MTIIERLEHAVIESALSMLDNEKADFLKAVDGVSDDTVNQLLTAFAKNLPAGGIKNEEWGPIRGAILQSLPDVDAIVNAKLAAGLDVLEAALRRQARLTA